MSNRKPIKIILFICMGLYILAMLIIVLATAMQPTVYASMAEAKRFQDVRVVPWANIFSELTKLVFSVLMLVLVFVAKGKGLRVAGIVVAVFIMLNNIFSTYSSAAESMMNARLGVEQLAAVSMLNSFLSVFTSPANVIAGTGLIFACGMCVFARAE